MVNLKKMFAAVGAKSGSELPTLSLSSALCNALTVVSQIFGQTWHMPVVGELLRTLQVPNPPSGHTLSMILQRLFEEASISRPGLASRFVFSRNQIVYRSLDRRYVVLIVQGEGDTVRVVWQVSVRQAGTSFISYQVRGNQWAVVEWKVAEQSQFNLELLAKVGGEVLGYLDEFKLLPEKSPFKRALDTQVAYTVLQKEQASKEHVGG